jgi:flagellin
LTGLNVADDSGVAATYAIDAIASAIETVSAQRSALGALQNRLEHTINNLDNVVENTTSAESRIRDTDMAEEMVEYSKNNILAQAGQSMLAQANQATQGVMNLLQ